MLPHYAHTTHKKNYNEGYFRFAMFSFLSIVGFLFSSSASELEDNITALSSSEGCVYTPPHHEHRLWPSRAIDLCSGDMQSLVKRLPLRDISIKIVATMWIKMNSHYVRILSPSLHYPRPHSERHTPPLTAVLKKAFATSSSLSSKGWAMDEY